MPLTTLAVRRLAKPGRYADSNGLYLQITRTGGRSWLFRYMRAGKAHQLGLGPVAVVPLAEARDRALAFRRMLHEGRDPLSERRREAGGNEDLSFVAVAERYIAAHESGWRNAKHREQWQTTLSRYVFPQFGTCPVGEVDADDVLRALEPLWSAKPETARRVRGRIEAILDYARARGWRVGENPARWRGHLDHLLPGKGKVASVKHHAALPWSEVPALMARLGELKASSAAALRFLILTAARTGEVLGAAWSEVDLAAKLWTVPAARMKAGMEHRVPLSDAALAAVASQGAGVGTERSGWVFEGGRPGRPLSNMALAMQLRRLGLGGVTVHGFRSSFRDWAAEEAGASSEVAEAALAHRVSNKVEAAYRRGDLLHRRRELMDAWAKFCMGKVRSDPQGKNGIVAS